MGQPAPGPQDSRQKKETQESEDGTSRRKAQNPEQATWQTPPGPARQPGPSCSGCPGSGQGVRPEPLQMETDGHKMTSATY
jgi:hypothetical protein